MKTIIAGSRWIGDYETICHAINASGFIISEVVSGGSRGVDRLGEQWAYHQLLPVKRFPAEWHTLGKAAGPIRNGEMAEYADALIAIWDGKSKGTAHMIDVATALGLKVFIQRHP
jgi:hypothetical protein